MSKSLFVVTLTMMAMLASTGGGRAEHKLTRDGKEFTG
jgi:hypothetical protein